MTNFLTNGPDNAPTLLLAHGSGAPMDTPFMNEVTDYVTAGGVRVVRFEFSFMAGRRITGKKPPPPKAEKLIAEFSDILKEVSGRDIFIGGKSLGGRVASMMAQSCFDEGKIAGLVCLGYPFHPPGKPDRLRTDHFAGFTCPGLICQGENDPFGKREEIEQYDLPASLQFHWAPFGNHDLVPPKRSGLTGQDNWQGVGAAVADFMKSQAL
ncbi:MAG TPA: alpha/beta hydrolase [Rhizobiales bacterium]|nr:alpha/beta hydrolase [Hyphomicrobiales bacterium]